MSKQINTRYMPTGNMLLYTIHKNSIVKLDVHFCINYTIEDVRTINQAPSQLTTVIFAY